MDLKKLAASVTALAVIMGAAWSCREYLFNTFTTASAHQHLSQRVSYNELKDLYQDALDDYYSAKRMLNKYPNDPQVQQEFEDAKRRLDDLRRQLNATSESRFNG